MADNDWDFDAVMRHVGVRPLQRNGEPVAAPAPDGLSEAEAAEFDAAMAAELETAAPDAITASPRIVSQQPPASVADAPHDATIRVETALNEADATLFDQEWSQYQPEREATVDESVEAAPSRRSLIRRGRVVCDDQIDLHRLHRDAAIERLSDFLTSCSQRGLSAVKVIVGKGLHSPAGPVIKVAVEAWLKADPLGLVGEFYPAPYRQGGDGALIVFLTHPTLESSGR